MDARTPLPRCVVMEGESEGERACINTKKVGGRGGDHHLLVEWIEEGAEGAGKQDAFLRGVGGTVCEFSRRAPVNGRTHPFTDALGTNGHHAAARERVRMPLLIT